MRPDPRIGRRIRLARQEAGLSLARACGRRLSPSSLSMVERGKRGITADRLIVVAERLGRPLSYFLTDGADRPCLDALLRAGEKLSAAGAYSRAAAVYREVLPAIPDACPDLRARCAIRLGYALVKLRQYEFALAYLAHGKALALETADSHLVAQAHNAMGVYYVEQNEYRRALDELEAALAALRRDPRPGSWPLASVLVNLGHALRWLGRPDEALAHLDEAAGLAEAAGDGVQLGVIARNTAAVLIGLGAHEDARRRLEEARDHFTRAERPDLVLYAENGLGMLLLERGDVEQAIAHLRRAVSLCERTADDLGRARCLTELARAYVMRDRYDEAFPMVAEAIRVATRVNDDVETARAETLRGEILAARGRLSEAEAAFAYAIPIFERREQRKELIQAYASLGTTLQAEGRSALASAMLGHAVALAGVRVPAIAC